MSEDRVRARLQIYGRVQGVAYRANTEETANEYGLDGWIVNRDDGRVEAVFEGDRETVEEIIDWCQTGSQRANVDRVEVEYEEPEGTRGFHVRWSG
jgi:acylphosphatase